MDIQEIRIANYACNSLFAPQNGESRGLARNENLANIVDGLVKREHVQFSVVITKPECEAAKEAVRNEKIINHDIEKNERKKVFSSALEEMQKCIASNGKYCKEYRENQVRFACTEISLPYGIFQVTYKNHKQDHIKVDLYSPYIPHESERLSMLIYRKKNEQLYKIFSDEFDRILSHSEYLVAEG
ncbi:MAG: hypothetical protein PUD93_12705 [Lachnospiraceae bacterium]|nr:hypothetical protein [Lachnospiraceae bacterium]